jgi:cytidine deaminase
MQMLKQDSKKKLIQKAIEAQEFSYSPYSNYVVGAALLGKSGKVFIGANIENAVYPLGLCAERAAVFGAVSRGEKEFEAIAVVTRDGGTPCGACRQVLAEFGLDIQVLIADSSGALKQEISVEELLPFSFGPENLNT